MATWTGGPGPDQYTGGDEDDVIDGAGGDDTLDGGGGVDTLNGGPGNDTLIASAGSYNDDALGRRYEYLYGGDGDDIFIVDADNAFDYHRLDGGDGFDVIVMDHQDYLGVTTDDWDGETFPALFSGSTTNVMLKSIEGLGAYETTDLAALRFRGDDEREPTVFFTNLALLGTEAINGFGTKEDNYIRGNDAANYLNGRGGADTLEGRGGDDTYVVNVVGDQVIEAADGGRDEVRSHVSFTLGDHVEDLQLLGGGATTGEGNALANVIVGNGANNILRGFGGADRLDGGLGEDVMYGGFGNDKYYVEDGGDRVFEGGSAGWDTVFSSVTFTLPANVEQLVLVGTGAIDGTGNELANVITGNDGANTLIGGRGADTIDGGVGPDRLFGGLGNDSLKGGSGYDGFYFSTALDPSNNVDTILAFSPFYDTIFLSRSIFTALPAGALSEEAFHTGSSAGDPSDRIIYQKSTGSIFYDADGSGGTAAVLFAQVAPGTELTYLDFNVYVPG
ncbi:MAG: calcium-binding protein [Pseudomonadota bacterium]|nr:calcium-binding protein [Pseudomonadota bacterium]